MPKHEKGTPKEIANRCKSKGLQKLRWYCEMCRKQCRDQNGFKCHLTSEAHQRQLLLFAENSKQYLSEFSNEFKSHFLLLLKTAHGTKRVRANEVYQEYIRDKGHVHMNSTVWHSLTGFVQYLGKEGICHVDQTEKGWFIAYVDKEAEMRKAEMQRKAKAEKDDEERQREMIEAQLQRAKEKAGDEEEYKPSELIRNGDEEKIVFSLAPAKPTAEELSKPTPALLAVAGSVFDRKKLEIKKEEKKDADHKAHENKRSRNRSRSRSPHSRREQSSRSSDRRDCASSSSSKKLEQHKKSALEEIKEMEERRKEAKNRKDYWIVPGIVVKVMTKSLGSEFYKAKGIIKSLVDNYTANVKTDIGATLKVDQSSLETVIPAIGRTMLIVNGAYRGEKAVLEEINQVSFSLRLSISEGVLKGRVVSVPYEDASKLA